MPILRPTFIAKGFESITPDLIAPYDMVLTDADDTIFTNLGTELDIEVARRFELMDRMDITAGVISNATEERRHELIRILREHMDEEMILVPSVTGLPYKWAMKPWPTMILDAMAFGANGNVLYIDDQIKGIISANLANTALSFSAMGASMYGNPTEANRLSAVDSIWVAPRGGVGNGHPDVDKYQRPAEEVYRIMARLPRSFDDFPDVARQVSRSAVESLSRRRSNR